MQVEVAVLGCPFLIVLMVSVGGRKATFQKKKKTLYASATTLWCPGYPRLVGVVATEYRQSVALAVVSPYKLRDSRPLSF